MVRMHYCRNLVPTTRNDHDEKAARMLGRHGRVLLCATSTIELVVIDKVKGMLQRRRRMRKQDRFTGLLSFTIARDLRRLGRSDRLFSNVILVSQARRLYQPTASFHLSYRFDIAACRLVECHQLHPNCVSAVYTLSFVQLRLCQYLLVALSIVHSSKTLPQLDFLQ